MKLYHGTTIENWNRIKLEGMNSGDFATDPAFSSTWKGIDTVVIEADLPKELLVLLVPGSRVVAKDVTCGQFRNENCIRIDPKHLRLMSDEEVQPHRDYYYSLTKE